MDLFDYGTDLAAACRHEPELFPFLLESAARGGAQGRCDILFARPDPEMLVLHADGRLTGPHASGADGDFLAALDHWWRAERGRAVAAAGEAPFRGGFFLYLGYELIGQIEPNLGLTGLRELPIAFAARVPAALIRDHVSGSLSYHAETGTDPALVETLSRVLAAGAAMETPALAGGLEEEAPQRYLDQVQRARHYIYEGDIFQANLSRRWSATLADDATTTGLYARLRPLPVSPCSEIPPSSVPRRSGW
jgi:anthranilate synthase component I